MGLTRTALQLAGDARNRADQKVGAFRDNTAVYRYLTESCRSLVDKLITDYGEMYWCDSQKIFAVPNILTTDVPDGVWKAVMLRVTLNDLRGKIPVAFLDDIDAEASSVGGWTALWPKYRIMGGQFFWTPTPRATHEVTLYFVDREIFQDAAGNAKDDLLLDTDKFDGVEGWEKWVVLDTAIKLRSDEGKDTDKLELEQQKRYDEISASAADRMTSEAPRVQDTWRGGERSNWRWGIE